MRDPLRVNVEGVGAAADFDDLALIDEFMLQAAERSLRRIHELWKSSHNPSHRNSRSSLDGLEIVRLDQTVYQVRNSAPHSFYVRPVGGAPHQFTTMPLIAEDETLTSFQSEAFADAIERGVHAMLQSALNEATR